MVIFLAMSIDDDGEKINRNKGHGFVMNFQRVAVPARCGAFAEFIEVVEREVKGRTQD